MGKLAQMLGVGVKGSIAVVPEKEVYMAGETVTGVAKVHVAQPIECGGCETVGWCESSVDSQFSRTSEFLFHQLVLNADVGLYEPGEFEFTFAYRLRDTLPGTFDMKNRSAKHISDVDDSLEYTLRVQLPVTMRVAADLSTSRPIIVMSAPNSIDAKPVTLTASKHIFSFGCIPKGDSCVTLSMGRDVSIVGETAELQVTIENLASKKVASAKVLVYEDVAVNVPDRGETFGSRVVCEKKIANAAGSASQLIDERVALPLMSKSDVVPLAPNRNASFIRWRYRTAVQCKYRLGGRLEVDTPIYIMRHDPLPVVDASKAARAVRTDGASWY